MAAPVCLGVDKCGLDTSGISLGDPLTLLAIAIFAGMIAIVPLLPDFDGTDDEDWGAAAGDDLWKH